MISGGALVMAKGEVVGCHFEGNQVMHRCGERVAVMGHVCKCVSHCAVQVAKLVRDVLRYADGAGNTEGVQDGKVGIGLG